MKRELTVILKAKFGSDFQRDVHSSSLKMMLDVWKWDMQSKHKKNEAEILYEENE